MPSILRNSAIHLRHLRVPINRHQGFLAGLIASIVYHAGYREYAAEFEELISHPHTAKLSDSSASSASTHESSSRLPGRVNSLYSFFRADYGEYAAEFREIE